MTITTNPTQGMVPAKSMLDVAYSSTFLWYPISAAYASNIFVGSPVTITSGYAAIGAANTAIWGSARSFKNFSAGAGVVAPTANSGVIPSTIQKYWQASTVNPTGVLTYVAIEVDPNTLYDMQANVTDLATGFLITRTGLGESFSAQTGFGAGDGSSATGYSTSQLTTGNGSTSNFALVNLSPNIGNAWATANNNALVKINNHALYAIKAI